MLVLFIIILSIYAHTNKHAAYSIIAASYARVLLLFYFIFVSNHVA
jgi:hypothetical protein